MKKRFLFVIGLLFLLILNSQFSILNSQQLPNSSFENWEHDALNNFEDGQRPVNWNTSNIKKTVVGITAGANMVFPDGNAHSGTYCAKAINTEVGAAGITETSPAWLTLGKPWSFIDGLNTGSATAGTDGGMQFSFRPDTIAVWIKRTSSGNENAHIVFYSWKGTSTGNSYKNKNNGCTSTTHYDEESDIRLVADANECGTAVQATQVAEAMWRSKERFNEWTEIKIPIKYLTNDKPEKCNVIISAANYPNYRANTVELGATIWADDVRMIYSSKVHEVLLGGRKMSGFNQNVYEMEYGLGKSATEVPEITLKRSGRLLDSSEYTVDYGAIEEITTITVKAEDGSSTTTYKIKFVGEKLMNNSRPADILVDGLSLSGFNPYVFTYNVELPFGTTTVPAISVIKAEDEQTVNVTQATSTSGSAKVVVTAPDKTTKSTYTINFSVAPLKDNTLTDIRVNGETIRGFAPYTNNYVVELPLGTTAAPKVEYTTAYPEHHDIVVEDKGIEGGVVIKVTPKGTTNTRTYRITYKITESSYSRLEMIYVDGKELVGFDKDKTSYTINLGLGVSTTPKITWKQGDNYQTVTFVDGGLEGTSQITVKSQSGTSTTIYRITFVVQKSSVSTLTDIKLNGISIDGFDPNVKDYVVNLPLGTTSVPTLTYIKGDDNQTVTVNNAANLSGTTRVTVTAQDGSYSIYTIKYSVQQSSVSILKGIQLDGILIDGFDSNKFEYSILLPRGTTKLPVISWTVADEFQTVRLTEGGVNGESRITVVAQSGDRNTYVLKFKVETNSNVNLNAIKVGGVAIEGFRADSLDYNFVLPSGTISLPEIEVEKADEAQIVVIQKGGVNGVTLIKVSAEDGTLRTYSIAFSVEKSANAFLEMIYADGVELVGFNAEVLEYEYEVSADATRCPTFTVDKSAGQVVSVVSPQIVGIVKITVKPESGAANVYTIRVHYPESNQVALKDIKVAGTSITGFDTEVLEYTYKLPLGTSALPTIEYEVADTTQLVYVEKGGVNSDTRIYVRAENGDERVYIIHFEIEKSSVATLRDIKVGGVSIADFDSNKFEYDVELPIGSSVLPNISYTKDNDAQQLLVSLPSLEGKATIEVTSADKTQKQVYTLNIIKALSTNVELSQITVNGRQIEWSRFVGDSVIISSLELGTQTPFVSCIAGDVYQTIAIADAGWKGSDILVVSEDRKSQRLYKVRYNIEPTSVATLADLQLYSNDGSYEFKSIDGFQADKKEYTIQLPWRTRIVPQIYAKPTDANAAIEIQYGAVNETTVVKVTSPDATKTEEYKVKFVVEKSNIATLSSVELSNQEISFSFDENVFDYQIYLPYKELEVPTLKWINGNHGDLPEQNVIYKHGNLLTPSTLTVIAEDGTTNVYTFTFKKTVSDKANVLQTVTIGSQTIIMVDGQYEYDVVLPRNTVVVPEISYIKSYDEQAVFVSANSPNGKADIVVYSQDAKDRKKYTFNLSVDNTPIIAFDDIKVNGVSLAGFNPEKTTYVYEVTDGKTPTVSYTIPDGLKCDTLINNANAFSVSLYDQVSEAIYSIYYHYSTDVIPNADFSQWGTAVNNGGAKPIGWEVPADKANKHDAGLGTFKTGSEVKNESSAVRLSITSSNLFAGIGGSFPTTMALTGLNVTFADAGNTTVTVAREAGINYRNTPDVFYFDSKRISSTKVDEWYALVNVGDGSTMQSNKLTQSFKSYDANLTTQSMALTYPSGVEVNKLNIAFNIAGVETCGYNGGQKGELLLDNLRFSYNNLLSDIKINGQSYEHFNPTTFTYNNLMLDAESILPTIEVVGQVKDQEHTIVLTEEDAQRRRTATITSKGEDGQVVTYKINFVRNESYNNKLSGLYVGGVLLNNFNSDSLNYIHTIPNLERQLPSVTAVGASYHQTIEYGVLSSNTLSITVTAESGDKQIYTIKFVEEKDNVVTLKSITDLNGFDATVYEYNVQLAANDPLPIYAFERESEGQVVTYTAAEPQSKFEVLAQDGKTKGVYTINFKREVPVSNKLTSLVINGEAIAEFAEDKYSYEFDATDLDDIKYAFTSGGEADDVKFVSNNGTIEITVGSNSYTIVHSITPKSLVDLNDLFVNSNSIDGFAPAIDEYELQDKRESHYLRAVAPQNAFMSVTFLESENVDLSKPEAIFKFSTISEDLQNTKDTRVVFATHKSDVVVLDNILINGSPLVMDCSDYKSSSAFDANTHEYDIEMKYEGEIKMSQPQQPAISVEYADYGQTSNIVSESLVNGVRYIIGVTSESGATEEYVLNVTNELSNNTSLNDLALNYISIDGFNSDKLNYSYSVDAGNNSLVVTYERGDVYQNVEIEETAKSIIVKVTAENGDIREYRIDLNTHYSRVVTLAAILKDGQILEGFKPSDFEYSFDLPIGTVVVPELSVVAGQDGQSVEIIDGGLDSTTVIRVTAEDGSSIDYQIHYNLLLSEENRLNMIYVNGSPLVKEGVGYTANKDFDAKRTEYKITTMVGTQKPIISYDAMDNWQTIEMKDNEDGSVSIIVSPQRKGLEREYIIEFETIQSSNSALKALYVDGVGVEGFEPDKLLYSIALPVGATTLPTIEWELGDEYQSVSTELATTFNEANYINVAAGNRDIKRTYIVIFTQTLSGNNQLSGLYISGMPNFEFDPAKTEYTVQLPMGETELPELTYEKGDESQSIEVENRGVDGGYKIVVTAGDGTTNYYFINFVRELSNVALLSGIYVDDVMIDAFDQEVYDYQLMVEYEQKYLPRITYSLVDSAASVEYIPAVQPGDTAIIKVTAEDGLCITSYKIAFLKAKCPISQVNSIKIGGEIISTNAKGFTANVNFAKDVYEYEVEFPYGTTELPEVEYEYLVDAYSSIKIEGLSLDSITRITIVSEDEMSISEYSIKYSVRKSDNAYLKSLAINEMPTAIEFDSLVFEYVVTFPLGTDTASLPVVDDILFEQVMPTQTVDVSSVSPTEHILLVTAEDGVTMNVYQIKFEILLSNNVLLNDLLVDGVSIANFSSTQHEYTYRLFPSAAIPEVTFEKAEEEQIVDITYGVVGEQTIIFVEAQDGSVGTYVINFVISEENPGDKPTYDDVAWSILGDGYFQASSMRDNVQVMIYTAAGTRVLTENVGLVDPNDDIRLPHDGGTVIYLPNNRQIYIYTFVYDNKVIASGKFVR